MVVTTIEGGLRLPDSPTTAMELAPQHSDPLGFADDNALDLVRAEWTRERGHWLIEYRNKVWSEEEVAAAQAMEAEDRAEEEDAE